MDEFKHMFERYLDEMIVAQKEVGHSSTLVFIRFVQAEWKCVPDDRCVGKLSGHVAADDGRSTDTAIVVMDSSVM